MAEISVTADSRFPTAQAYDSRAHAYRNEYLNPRGWGVTLSACGGLPTEVIRIPGDRVVKPRTIVHHITPDDVVAYRWRAVNRLGESVSSRTTGGRNWVPCESHVVLPRPGRYAITLTEELTTGRTRETQREWHLRDHLVLCLGDSFASGEGNPTRFGSPTAAGRLQCEAATLTIKAFDWGGPGVSMASEPAWVEPDAHRSYLSGHAAGCAAAERPSDGRVITFMSFATSGAETGAGLLNSQHPWQRRGQVDEARAAIGDRSPNAVILSIGGNDVGFSSGLQDLASDFRGGGLSAMRANTLQKIRSVGQKFDDVADKLADLAPDAVFISEYPAAFFDKPDELGGPLGRRVDGCGVFDSTAYLKISAVDAAVIFDLAHRLNDEVRAAADRHGWRYVDGIVEGFAGHGYCQGAESYFVTASQSCRRQGDFLGTMHPNARGHRVYRSRVAAGLSHVLDQLSSRPDRPGHDDTHGDPDSDVVRP